MISWIMSKFQYIGQQVRTARYILLSCEFSPWIGTFIKSTLEVERPMFLADKFTLFCCTVPVPIVPCNLKKS